MKGNNTNTVLSANQLIKLLHDLDGTEYQVNDVEQFVADTIEFDVPLSDIRWFYEWEPVMLCLIERAYQPHGYFEIFPDWDAYIEAAFDCWDDDPHQPFDGTVTEDAGLSGVWYVQLF